MIRGINFSYSNLVKLSQTLSKSVCFFSILKAKKVNIFCRNGLKKSATNQIWGQYEVARYTQFDFYLLGTEVEPMLIITESAYEKLVKITKFKLDENDSILFDEEEDENNV